MGCVRSSAEDSREGDFGQAGVTGLEGWSAALGIPLPEEMESFNASETDVVVESDGREDVSGVGMPRSSRTVPGRARASCCSLATLDFNHGELEQ